MKIIIVGAGFGGLRLARKLNNKAGFDVTLIDKFNYHQFQPLFYQVATAGLDASNISFPLRKVFQKSKNVKIRLAELKEIVSAKNMIKTDVEDIYYDILVIAAGATTNFFNNEQIEQHAFPMKSTVEALQIRHRLLQMFENAHTIEDGKELQKIMNIVVVGGGPTGVEVSGALAEMKKYVLPKDYPELDFSKMNIYLVEGASKTLSTMREKSSDRSMCYLAKLGVQVITEKLVKNYDGNEVLLNDGMTISSSTVIWAAGVKGNIPEGIDKALIANGNRILIDQYCKVIGIDNIYAIGDIAIMQNEEYKNGHPQVAPVAIQQADLLAYNFHLIGVKRTSKTVRKFKYNDKGSMATVGRNLAVVDIPTPRLSLGGFIAWLIWMGLHLMLILGVKNRFFVFMNWLYNYFTYDQNLRLIFKEFNKTESTI